MKRFSFTGDSANDNQKNTALCLPEGCDVIFRSILKKELSALDQKIRNLLTERGRELREEDELIDRCSSELASLSDDLNMYAFDDEMTERLNEAKGAFCIAVGTHESVRPEVEPLLEKRGQYRRRLRAALKTSLRQVERN